MFEVVLDDLGRTAELGESLSPKNARVATDFHVPQLAHHQLEVGRLNTVAACCVDDDATATGTELDPPGRNLVENGCNQSRVSLDAALGWNVRVETCEGTANGRLATKAIQVLQSQSVRQQIGNFRLERVQQ